MKIYIIMVFEYEIFLKCAKLAGLEKIQKHSKVFPNDKLITIKF